MNKKNIIEWTHWYEPFPMVGYNCIILQEGKFFKRKVKILFKDTRCNELKDAWVPKADVFELKYSIDEAV